MNFEKLQVLNAILTIGNLIIMMYCIFIVQDIQLRWWLIYTQLAMVLAQVILVIFLVREIMRDW
jgi:hypothetical protein